MRRNHWHGWYRTKGATLTNRLDKESFGFLPKLLGPSEGDAFRLLRIRAQIVSQRLETIKRRIESQKIVVPSGSKIGAIVDEDECTGCGLCCEVCPRGAISLNGTAKIDTSRCTACLACVKQCPQGAIAIKYQSRWRFDFKRTI
jgi:ferredoxin